MDVVVTVPKGKWAEWIAEGDLPGEPWSGIYSFFNISHRPKITPGERVYVVAHGKLRGYAPLWRISSDTRATSVEQLCLERRGGAVAVTRDIGIKGFQGWRYRWWQREEEYPFPEWRVP